MHRSLLLAPAGVLSLVLAACGSQVSPGDMAGAGGGHAGGAAPASGSDEAVVVDTDGDGVVDANGGTAGTPGTTGSSGSSGGGTSAGGGAGPGGGGAGPKGGGGGDDGEVDVASCQGFQNGPGITDTTIAIGNSSDISGPVPGLFESAQDATKAFVTYFNAANPDGICGRSLVLRNADSQTDAGADQRNYADACKSVFAMVGSMSAFTSGGAGTAASCGLPDIRSAGVTRERQACATCYGAQSTIAGEVNNAIADYTLENFPAAAKAAAMLYINAGASAENGQAVPKALSKRGMVFKYVQGIDISEFNYAPFVQTLKDRGIRYVQMVGAVPQFVRMAQAMRQQGYEPDVFMFDPTAYDPAMLEQGGEAVEGATVYTNFVPFEEAGRSPETRLYLSWLQQAKPGAVPDFFGVFAWSAARLFVEEAAALGGRLSRPALVEAVREVDAWTANGLHSPQRVGPKRTGECFRFIQVRNGRWVPVGGSAYRCKGTTTVD